MAPGRTREPSIDRTSLYTEFIAKLTEYHEKRGYILRAPSELLDGAEAYLRPLIGRF